MRNRRQQLRMTVALMGAIWVSVGLVRAGIREPTAPLQSPPFILPATRNWSSTNTPVKLASGGQALLPIIIAPDAGPALRDSATELARVLRKMTGAEFQIQTNDVRSGLVLGTSRQFPHPELEPALKSYRVADDQEAYTIRTSPGCILLLGATELGAGNAVYRFLAELGCRWLSPAVTWEIIPEQRELTWCLDITDRPDIPGRRIWYAIATQENREAYNRWRVRNNHNSGLQVNAGHAWYQIFDENKAAFSAHPEYWPLINGVRATNLQTIVAQPDIGNPAVRQMFIDHALNTLRKDREMARAKGRAETTMVSLEPNDGGAFSGSPEFKALGTLSDAVFGLANEVARAVAREFPGKMVGMLAYREHADPPDFPLENNVYVQITPALFTQHTREEVVALWVEKCANLGFYEYYMPYEWSLDQLPGGNASSLSFLATSIRRTVAQHASSIDGQGSGCWFLNGMGYWIASQLMWNSQQDVETLKTDYLTAAYGPASETLRHFYALWDPDTRPIISKNLVYEMALALQKADDQIRALNATDPRRSAEIHARLDDLRHYLRFLELDWTLQAMGKEGPYEVREAAFIALFKHILRTQSHYMNEVELAQQNLFQQRGEKSGLILVNQKPKPKVMINTNLLPWAKNNPWKVSTPYTAEEIAANFQSTLAYFKTEPLQEKPFSSDLVPVRWSGPQAPGVPATRETLLKVQSCAMRWAVYSFGEPIRVRVEPGTVYSAFMPRPWTLTDSAGRLIAEGGVAPKDSDEQKNLKISVPSAGNYVFEIQDRGGGFLGVAFPSNQPATFLLTRGVRINEQGPSTYNQPRCFYVPKGTAVLQFFSGAAPRQTTKVYGPDGKVQVVGGGFREWTSVPIPPGQDGKVWRMDAGLHTLWFANVPPGVAAAPERLLVPRDLAETDGLEIRKQ